MNSKKNTETYQLKLHEDQNHLFLDYQHLNDKFSMIYSKEKDLVLILKNKRPVDLNKLSKSETERYKDVLDIAITYHHNRDGAMIN